MITRPPLRFFQATSSPLFEAPRLVEARRLRHYACTQVFPPAFNRLEQIARARLIDDYVREGLKDFDERPVVEAIPELKDSAYISKSKQY